MSHTGMEKSINYHVVKLPFRGRRLVKALLNPADN